MNFKTPIERSPKYLMFVRSQPYLQCQRPNDIDAHHTETGGMGIKGSDYSAIPLCWRCHKKIHDLYGKKGPWPEDTWRE